LGRGVVGEPTSSGAADDGGVDLAHFVGEFGVGLLPEEGAQALPGDGGAKVLFDRAAEVSEIAADLARVGLEDLVDALQVVSRGR